MFKALIISASLLVSFEAYAQPTFPQTVGMLIKYIELCGSNGKFHEAKMNQMKNKFIEDNIDSDSFAVENEGELNYGFGSLEGAYLYGTLVLKRKKYLVCDDIDAGFFG